MAMTNEDEEKRLTLSVEEACRLLGISRASLYQGIHSGEIPSFRVGHRYVIPRAPLERILNATTSYRQKDSDSLKKTVGLPGESVRPQPGRPTNTEVSQKLEKVSESLNDIMKRLEAAGPAAGAEDEASSRGAFKETAHKAKMRELARALAKKIQPPSLWDKDLWRDLPVDFKPKKYSVPIGTAEIGDDKRVEVHFHDPAAGVAAPHLVSALYNHLGTPASGFAELVGGKGKLEDWKGAVEKYSESLLTFLSLMTDEAVGYGAGVSFHDEAEPGLTKWFIATAWGDAIQVAGGHPWIDESWYKPHDSIPGTGLWQLWCGAYIVGIAGSGETLDAYENWHKELRAKHAGKQLAQDIAAEYEQLNNTAQDIRQRLQAFSDMQRLPGHCGLC